ncbi:MAG: VOC family protein [Rhodobacteraceae bacterium]|nr:VOC family protein [Paracoccaceae bacterium]
MQPDHLAVVAETLEAGVAHVEEALGVAMVPGGRHDFMGTHNRLLGLGPGFYLEVIAIDPDANPPPYPRWFNLDGFTGAPRLANWICRTGDLDAALAAAPSGAGRPMDAARGDLKWRMAIPADGCLPFDGAFPGLIEWAGAAHPSDRLPENGCRMTRLEIMTPDHAALGNALPAMPNVVLAAGPLALRVKIDTPNGPRVLM